MLSDDTARPEPQTFQRPVWSWLLTYWTWNITRHIAPRVLSVTPPPPPSTLLHPPHELRSAGCNDNDLRASYNSFYIHKYNYVYNYLIFSYFQFSVNP